MRRTCLPVFAHFPPCKRSGAWDHKWAFPSEWRKSWTQLVPDDLEESKQPCLLFWAMRWEDQHKHAKVLDRLRKERGKVMFWGSLKMMKKTIDSEHNQLYHHNPHHSSHIHCPSLGPSVHGSYQVPWEPAFNSAIKPPTLSGNLQKWKWTLHCQSSMISSIYKSSEKRKQSKTPVMKLNQVVSGESIMKKYSKRQNIGTGSQIIASENLLPSIF